MIHCRFGVWLALLLPAIPGYGQASPTIHVGSKSFTESVILAEIVAQLARQQGVRVEHVAGLGGTRLLWEALLAGQIDVYPEYTGTLCAEIFSGEGIEDIGQLRARLASHDLVMTDPLGFNNTYIIGMKEAHAGELNIRSISDLRDHPELVLRFSNEFMQRDDGWGALASMYRLPHRNVRGLEHALAYEALDKGVIDVTDLYSTDAKIRKLGVRGLHDDLFHFPDYHAVYVFRGDLVQRLPDLVKTIRTLETTIDESTMIDLNASVELDGLNERQAASGWLQERMGVRTAVRGPDIVGDIARHTIEHLHMVGVSLGAAVAVAIPLGIVAARTTRLAQPILGVVGVIQTVPSIALLVLLIRPVSYFTNQIGHPQAVVALFLYSLLPIVRNTHAGLTGISPSLRESALALGLPATERLWRIELPLASRVILAGIKTSAVINVGFATLGGFIGAGGYGEPIFAGIRLNDYGIILQGALPAAALALLVQGLFEVIDRVVVPRGLRLKFQE